MTGEGPIEEPDAVEHHVALTPDQRERLKSTMKRLQQAPQSDFNRIKILSDDMAKMLSSSPHRSAFKNVSIMPAFSFQQAKRFEAFKPALAAHEAMRTQFEVINSDIFKHMPLAQSSLDAITAQLTNNLDLGLPDTFTRLAKQVATHQSTLLRTMWLKFESLHLALYPPNLREIDGLRFEEVASVVMADGIALYGVPRSSIAEALIHADSAAKRRDIIGRRWKAISADCRTTLEGCDAEPTAPFVPKALAALDALDAGHSAAAQALTGALLDSMVNSYFGQNRYRYTPDKKGNRTNAAYDEFSAHDYIALAPIWQAWQKFFPDEGLPIPHTFSRNATAHTVSAKQYTKRNAMQSLMIASSLLYFFDSQAALLNTA